MLSANNIKQATLILLAGSLCAIMFFSMYTNTSIGMILAYMTPYPFLMIGYATGLGTVLLATLIATISVYLFGSSSHLAMYFFLLLALPSLIIIFIQEQDSESLNNKLGKTILTLGIYFIALMIIYNYLLYFQASSLELAILNLKAGLIDNLTNSKQFNSENLIFLQNVINLYFVYLPAFTLIGLLLIFFLNWTLAFKTVKRFSRALPSPGKIQDIQYPLWVFLAFIGACTSFLFPEAKISYILQNVALIFGFLYLIKGIAFVHLFGNERIKRLKVLVYILFYALLLISSWFNLLIIILGVIDHLFSLRKYIDYKLQV